MLENCGLWYWSAGILSSSPPHHTLRLLHVPHDSTSFLKRILLYITTAFSPPYFLPVSHQPLLSLRFPHPLQKGSGLPQNIDQTLAPQVIIRPGTYFHIKAGWGNPIGEKSSQNQTKESDSPRSHCQEYLKNIKLHNHNMCAESLGRTHISSLISGSHRESSVDSVDCSCDVFYPFGSSSPSFSSFEGLPEVCLIFGLWTLHLLPQIAGWSLSDLSHDSYARF